jgi:hypothetical protein
MWLGDSLPPRYLVGKELDQAPCLLPMIAICNGISQNREYPIEFYYFFTTVVLLVGSIRYKSQSRITAVLYSICLIGIKETGVSNEWERLCGSYINSVGCIGL